MIMLMLSISCLLKYKNLMILLKKLVDYKLFY